jgi:hypothetical protein
MLSWDSQVTGVYVMRRIRSLLSSLLLLLAATADAHHSPNMFDPTKAVTVSGVVRVFQWTNPHCYIQLLVKNADGKPEEWSLEMGATMYLYNQGWRPSTLKAGDAISVKIAPLRKGGTGGMVLEAVKADGSKLGGTKP